MGEPSILDGHRRVVYRYILSIMRDPAAAEDLAQETLLRAHRKLSTLHDPDRLSAWLYRIATNVCRDRFRREAYRGRTEPIDPTGEGPPASDGPSAGADANLRLDKVMERREMSVCVQEYLADLSDSYRAVIMLHDLEGLTNPEIASMLGVSLPTVKIRLHRAREKLRHALGQACTFSTDERGVLICERKPPKTRE